MKISRITRILGVALLAALVLGVVSMAGAQDAKKVLITGINMVGADPETIDPALSQASQENQIINEMFIGLTQADEITSEVQPGLAESYDVSEDGLTYTFHLMKNVPWVHYNADTDAVEEVKDDAGNVRMVTAADVVYGIKRTLDPATAGLYAFILLNIEGAKEFNDGTAADSSGVAVKAIDDNTLEIKVIKASTVDASILGLWPANAQPQWAIEAGGDSWTEPEYINTFGPYTLKEWAHDESITLIKNPFWPGVPSTPQAKIDEIVLKFLAPQAQFAEFQAGTIDAIDVPLEQMDLAKTDATLKTMFASGTSLCTYYVGFNTLKPPLDNVHLRRALSYAIDRQTIVDNVTKGNQVPAQWFARPGLLAAPTLETNPDLGIKFDPEMAKTELDLALKDLGLASAADLPPIPLSYNDSSGHAAIMGAIQQMWTTTLGINAQLNAMDSTTYFSILNTDAPQVYRAGWCLDYPDANNFDNDVFRSTSTQNGTNFKNADFDSLMDQALAVSDVSQRRELYVKAEDILINQEAAIAPIYWYTYNQLTQPYVERTYGIINRQRLEKWDINKP